MTHHKLRSKAGPCLAALIFFALAAAPGAWAQQQQSPISFSVDRNAQGVAGTGVQANPDPAHIFTSPADGTNFLAIDKAALGLGDDDNVDAFTVRAQVLYEGPEQMRRDVRWQFSVDPDAVGLHGTPANVYSEQMSREAAGDVFWTLGAVNAGANQRDYDEQVLGLVPGSADKPEDDLDALENQAVIEFEPQTQEYFFSLTPDSPTLAANGWSPADILVSTGDGSVQQYLKAEEDIGLDVADDIDALHAGQEMFFFSVAPNSASGLLPGDVFTPDGWWGSSDGLADFLLPAGFFGLLKDDNLNALDAEFREGGPGQGCECEGELIEAPNVPVPIPDVGQAQSFITTTAPLLLTDVDVHLDIIHPVDGHLAAKLEFFPANGDPSTGVVLFVHVGGQGANFQGTVLDDTGPAGLITYGAAPFSDCFMPENALAAFNGQVANGNWVLTIRDSVDGSMGELVRWALCLNGRKIEPKPGIKFSVERDDDGLPGTAVNQNAATDPASLPGDIYEGSSGTNWKAIVLAQLGLQPDDNVDALSILDERTPYVQPQRTGAKALPKQEDMLVCPDNSIHGQLPVAPGDRREAWASDAATNTRVFEDYRDVRGIIADLHWWGFVATPDGQQPCDRGPTEFEIGFWHPAADGKPGILWGSSLVTPTATPTGVDYNGMELIRYDVNLDPIPRLSTGWLSIQGQSPDDSCIFHWVRSDDGDGLFYQETAAGGLSSLDPGVAYCFTGRPGDDCAVCPGNAIYEQPPVLPDGGWEANLSNEALSNPGRRLFDNFVVDTPILDVHWWGITGRIEGEEFHPCNRNPDVYRVGFYDMNSDGKPGNLVYEWKGTPTQILCGYSYDGAPLYRYDLVLPEAVYLSNGWLSVQGIGDTACRFFWMRSDAGDGIYYEQDPQGVWSRDPDLAFCLTGDGGGENCSRCPKDAIFDQPPHRPDDSWQVFQSNHPTSLRYGNFRRVRGAVRDIHWWGFFMRRDENGETLVPCEAPPEFKIVFYQNNGSGYPGSAVCSYKVTATVTPSGMMYSSGIFGPAELLCFDAVLDPPCNISSGWVSIQGIGDRECMFYWVTSPVGDSIHWGEEPLGQEALEDPDLAFCLTGKGDDPPPPSAVYWHFSVDPEAKGITCPAPDVHQQASLAQASGDVFVTRATNCNKLAIDEVHHGLDQYVPDDLDALDLLGDCRRLEELTHVAPGLVFFSLTKDSPTVQTGGAGQGDILVSRCDGTFSVYLTADEIGIPNDDLDALVMSRTRFGSDHPLAGKLRPFFSVWPVEGGTIWQPCEILTPDGWDGTAFDNLADVVHTCGQLGLDQDVPDNLNALDALDDPMILLDTDEDGITDPDEDEGGFDPLQPLDALIDADGDGLSRVAEQGNGTDPDNPDSDGDGVNDGDEVDMNRDPTTPDPMLPLQGLALTAAVLALTAFIRRRRRA